MSPLFNSIIATLIVSLLSLVGVFTLAIKHKLLDKIVFYLVGFSAGALMGGAFLHLIPESVHEFHDENIYLYILIGFCFFFVIERFLHWHHCHHDNHDGECKVHPFSYMILIGDGVHNFIDGLIIAAAFVADYHLGVITTIAVIAHEIPQEIGDFGVLIYGGFSKAKALFFNFLSATTAILGAVIGVLLTTYIDNFTLFLLPFTAGGFIYIAASDLIPELHKEPKLNKSITAFICFLIGIALMYGMKFFIIHSH